MHPTPTVFRGVGFELLRLRMGRGNGNLTASPKLWRRMTYRTPSPDNLYLKLLGRAAYTWSYAEWTALYIIRWATDDDLSDHAGCTGGKIMRALDATVRSGLDADPHVLQQAQEGARALLSANHRRNDLLHSRPATINGQQRLNRWDPKNQRADQGPIEHEDLEQFIRQVEAAGRLISPLHDSLRPIE